MQNTARWNNTESITAPHNLRAIMSAKCTMREGMIALFIGDWDFGVVFACFLIKRRHPAGWRIKYANNFRGQLPKHRTKNATIALIMQNNLHLCIFFSYLCSKFSAITHYG